MRSEPLPYAVSTFRGARALGLGSVTLAPMWTRSQAIMGALWTHKRALVPEGYCDANEDRDAQPRATRSYVL